MPKGQKTRTCANHECGSYGKPQIVNARVTACGCGKTFPVPGQEPIA